VHVENERSGEVKMSADNGTYILQTYGPEFRVVHAQAIDNIYGQYHNESLTWTPNPDMIVSYFGECKVFTDITQAWDEALYIDDLQEYSENGACLITEFLEYHFSDLVERAKNG